MSEEKVEAAKSEV
jgi:hypothetical protein